MLGDAIREHDALPEEIVHPDGLVRVTVASSSVPEVRDISKVRVIEPPRATLDAEETNSILHVGASVTDIGVDAVTSVALVDPEFADTVKGLFFVPTVSALRIYTADPPLWLTVFWQSDADGQDKPLLKLGVRIAVISLDRPLA